MKAVQSGNSSDSALRVRIIEAAKQLFVEHGFKGTTTKMIAKEAKVNEVTIFRHFTSKEGIFVEITNDIMKYDYPKLESIADSDIPLEEMFFRFGMELYHGSTENRSVLLVALIESRNRPELRKSISDILNSLVEILERRLTSPFKKGVLEEHDFYAVSRMYLDSLIGLFILQNRLEGDLNKVEFERLCSSDSKVLTHGLLKNKNI